MSTQQQEAELVTQVSVIGMGTMGAAMARRLLDADMEVSVWARRSSSTKALAEQGATAYELPTDAVKNTDVVISMLPTAEATAEVMFNRSVLEAMRSAAIWVQMATIGVEQTEQLAAMSLELRPEVAFVDAPVSGSRIPAEQGQLLVLASGPPEAEQPLQPVFAALGRDALWLGAAGAGSRLKLVLNTWLAFQTEGAAESAALAETLGVSSAALFDALRGNPLASPYALSKLAKMLDQNFDADFALDWALKDLDLVASAADPAVAPIASAIAERWRGLVHQGASGLDVSAARRGLT